MDTTIETVDETQGETASEDIATPFDEPEESGKQTAKVGGGKIKKFPVAAKPTLPPEKFFAFLFGLPQFARDRMALYVNRDYPKLDITRGLTSEELAKYRRNPRLFPTYIDKLGAPFESEDWKEEVLRRWGSGSYRFYLNDCGIRGDKKFPHQEICRCKVDVRDASAPPKVDLRKLDMNDPINESYKRELMLTGVLAPDESLTGKTTGDDDMAQSAAEAMQTLTTAVVELSKDKKNGSGDGTAGDAVARALDKAEDRHSRQMQELEQRHQRELADIRATIKEKASGTLDPMAAVTSLVDLAKTMVPQPQLASTTKQGTEELLLKMLEISESRHAREMEAVNRRLEAADTAMREMTKEMREILTKKVEAAAPVSELGLLDKLVRYQEKFKQLSGEGGDPKRPWWADLAEIVVDGVKDVTANLAEMSKKNNPLPSAPQNGTAQQPQQPMQQLPAPTAAQQQSVEEQQMNQLKIFARRIHPDLVKALLDNEPGYTFAARLMASNPVIQQMYGSIQLGGRDALLGEQGLLRLNLDLFGELVRPPLGGDRLEKFCAEFLDGARAMEVLRQIQQQSQPSTPRPQTQPVAPARPTIVPPSQPKPKTNPDGTPAA